LTLPVDEIRLLRAIYCHLDRQGVIADLPVVTQDHLIAFFQRVKQLLEEDAPVPAPAAASVAAGVVVLQCDGGARGNPGPAACAYVLADADGTTLAEAGRFLGSATCNEAEYRGLIAGLEKAREIGARRVEVRSDSELLVKQMRGEYRVRAQHLKGLHTHAAGLARSFESCSFLHVPRASNARADKLTNRAIKRGIKPA
jgi:ribonuclease HI